MIEYLDVSHNQINYSFPCWLGALPELKLIALSYNEFYGAIRCPMRFTFPKIHIIDLSPNEFCGSLPSEIIENWKSMKVSRTSQIQYEQWTFSYLQGKGGKQFWYQDNGYSFKMFNKGVVMVYERL